MDLARDVTNVEGITEYAQLIWLQLVIYRTVQVTSQKCFVKIIKMCQEIQKLDEIVNKYGDTRVQALMLTQKISCKELEMC